MERRRLSADDLPTVVSSLRQADPVLARVIDVVGPCQLAPSREGFPSLVRSLMFQQLAVPAARAILNRFLAIYSTDGRFPTPAEVLATPEETLRSAGISRQKMTYLRALAEKFVDHELDLGKLDAMDDEEIIKELTSVKGVGRWTAEMFLIFSLGRPDVLPVDDLGVRKGAQKTYGLPELPKAAELLSLGERWRPYRSVATWYLWRSLGVALPTGDGSAGPVPRP